MLVDDREMNDVSTKITSTRPVTFPCLLSVSVHKHNDRRPRPQCTDQRPSPGVKSPCRLHCTFNLCAYFEGSLCYLRAIPFLGMHNDNESATQLARIASRLQRQNVVLTIMCAALTINTVAIWSLPMLRAMERSQQHQRDQHSHHKSEVWHSVPQVQHEEHLHRESRFRAVDPYRRQPTLRDSHHYRSLVLRMNSSGARHTRYLRSAGSRDREDRQTTSIDTGILMKPTPQANQSNTSRQ